MTLDILEQIVRSSISYAASVISYRFIWKSKSTKKNLLAGLYFYLLSVLIGFICRQVFKVI